MRRTGSYTFLVVLVLIVVVIGGGYLGVTLYMGSAPEIQINNPPTQLGKKSTLKFTIHDPSQKLSLLKVTLVQGTREKVVDERSFDSHNQPMVQRDLAVEIEPTAHGLTQGPATCVIQAWGKKIGDFYQGKTSVRELPVNIDTVPPRIGMISRTIHLRMGGSGLVIYKLSPDVISHGVSVGQRIYPGHTAWKDQPHTALSYFALAQDQKHSEPMQVWAEDAAGNRTELPLPVRVRKKRFRNDKIRLSARTVKALAAKFNDQAPASAKTDIDVFVWINKTLRKDNDAKVYSVCNKFSPVQLWDGAFQRPRGKPMAGFGDRRTYFMGKKKISKAVHLGSDLADIAQSEISAAARGKVVFAAPLGIYGNCLILDHGLGVMTLYGHLSNITAMPGQIVERGDLVAQSGATGLALGDHLHFSVLVGGVFVQPTEWWDPHWIQDNIDLRFEEAGLKPPLDIVPAEDEPKKADAESEPKAQAENKDQPEQDKTQTQDGMTATPAAGEAKPKTQ